MVLSVLYSLSLCCFPSEPLELPSQDLSGMFIFIKENCGFPLGKSTSLIFVAKQLEQHWCDHNLFTKHIHALVRWEHQIRQDFRMFEWLQKNNWICRSHNIRWAMPNKALDHHVTKRQPGPSLNTVENGQLYCWGLARGMTSNYSESLTRMGNPRDSWIEWKKTLPRGLTHPFLSLRERKLIMPFIEGFHPKAAGIFF